MRYLHAGSGPKLLLIHGLLGYSFSWRRNLQALSKHFEVYAIDLPGIGFSERPTRGAMQFDLRSIAKRLLEWMEQEGIRDADVIGTSHGGGVAMWMAESSRTKKLVLVAPVNPWSRMGKKRTRFFGHPLGAFCLRMIGPMLPLVRNWALMRMYGDPSKITADTRAGYDAPLVIPGTLDYLLGIVQHWQKDISELELAIERLSGADVFLVWGDRDAAVPLSSGYELQKRLPGSELRVLKGVGHLPYEESPEEFNATVVQFLNGRR
jgi:pimeloyl-ACP methyl ester carboxylesterase